MPRVKPKKTTYIDKVNLEVQSNQSRLSMVLGALILLVIGILIFNYFNSSKPSLGPAQQTQQEDVTPSQLPGKYTVKENDTLFTISEKYYQDGSKFEDIAKANNLNDVNSIETGQVLELPKLEQQETLPSPTPLETSQTDSPAVAPAVVDITAWGPKITGISYTVQLGDWLSTIAARAYGDAFAFSKIAQANNIANPDVIYPGQVLTIPR